MEQSFDEEIMASVVRGLNKVSAGKAELRHNKCMGFLLNPGIPQFKKWFGIKEMPEVRYNTGGGLTFVGGSFVDGDTILEVATKMGLDIPNNLGEL